SGAVSESSGAMIRSVVISASAADPPPPPQAASPRVVAPAAAPPRRVRRENILVPFVGEGARCALAVGPRREVTGTASGSGGRGQARAAGGGRAASRSGAGRWGRLRRAGEEVLVAVEGAADEVMADQQRHRRTEEGRQSRDGEHDPAPEGESGQQHQGDRKST